VISDTGAGEPPVTRIEISDGRGVLAGDFGPQENKYIQTYVEKQVIQTASAPAGEIRVVTGDIPGEPAGFQPRADLLTELDAPLPQGRSSVVLPDRGAARRGDSAASAHPG
jgi:hypothetical protein